MDDAQLLAQCDVSICRASGPGGQHRNKVSTAVRLVHRPTGINAQGQESRSQHENRRHAVARLRMKIACHVRRPVDPHHLVVPEAARSCLHAVRGGSSPWRLTVGARDRRYWPVAQFLLDLLEAASGRLSEAARWLGVTTSNLASILKEDRHLHAAAQDIRTRHGQGPLK